MFRNLNIDEKHNNRTIEYLNRNNHSKYNSKNRESQQRIKKEINIDSNNQKIFHRIRRKSTSPTVELSSSFDCLERTDLYQHSLQDKQLIDWINRKLQSLGVDPVYYTSLIISLLNKSNLQNYSNSIPNDHSNKQTSEGHFLQQSNSQRNRLTSNSVYQLCNSREKLFVNDRKSVNNHQAASSTTKFMHKRYQDCVSLQSKHYEEEFGGEFDQRSNSEEVSEKLLHYLKDATAQNSTAIESFVNELLERFERAASGVAKQHHSEWMLAKDMDQKRRPIGNNEFSTKSTQSNNLSASVASNSTLNNNREDRDFWHRNVNRNFRLNQDNSETGVRNNDAHKYFNAFPALSDERAQSQGQVQQNPVYSVPNRSSKSNQWNGMKIIKNVADPIQPLNNNDNSNFTTLSSKANSSFAGKQRILVTPTTTKPDKILDNNNMVTLKKVAAGKKSGISNSPSRSESNMSNSKHLLDVSTKKKITKEDEKILSVMPNFMNPLKKNETNSGTSNENSNSEILKGKDKKSSNSSDGRGADNNHDESQSSSGSLRNVSQQEMNQKQREFFENKFIKRSNSFGTRESKKYGFNDETKKNASGTFSKNNTNSQTSSDDIDSDWRTQKTVVQNKNPLSVSNALVGIMPSYLKSVATADAQKVKKIEQKPEPSKNIKNSSTTVQPEDDLEPVTTSTIRSLTTMNSEEISKFWNEDSNMQFIPMLHESVFENDAVFKNFLDLDKQRKEDISQFKNFQIDLKPIDIGEYFPENDNKFGVDDLMKEFNNISLKVNNEKSNETTENKVVHVPYSKRKKYEKGGAETFGRCPLSLAAIEAEHERLKNTATFDCFDFSTSSNEDLSISYMFERENDFESQFILEECYEEEQHYNIQCEEDNEAEFYANDYENFLAENEKANAEAERIGFNEFITGNRHIDNTIDSVQKSQKPCKYLLEGFCARSDCKFSHNFKDITCRYWLEGYCNREHDCPFKHSLDDDNQISHYPSRDVNNENYDFDIDGDFPALARNNVQNSQSSSEMVGSPYYNNHNHLQNGKYFAATEEWPTLDINGTRQSRLYPPTSTSNSNSSTMDSFGIEFKVAKKKNRKDKSKFKN